jgi:hypothetical protein
VGPASNGSRRSADRTATAWRPARDNSAISSARAGAETASRSSRSASAVRCAGGSGAQRTHATQHQAHLILLLYVMDFRLHG